MAAGLERPASILGAASRWAAGAAAAAPERACARQSTLVHQGSLRGGNEECRRVWLVRWLQYKMCFGALPTKNCAPLRPVTLSWSSRRGGCEETRFHASSSRSVIVATALVSCQRRFPSSALRGLPVHDGNVLAVGCGSSATRTARLMVPRQALLRCAETSRSPALGGSSIITALRMAFTPVFFDRLTHLSTHLALSSIARMVQ